MTEDSSITKIGRGMAKGAAWMVLLRFAIRGLGLINTIVLARFLLPSDFGLIALATMVSAFIETLSEFNFDTALIREQNADRSHYDTVWTLLILRGVAIGLVLVILAAPAAVFFADPRLETIIYVFAGLSVFDAFQNVGIVDWRKNLQFSRDFSYMFWPRLVAFLCTVAAVVVLKSYWALVVGAVVERLMRVAMSYLLHPYRPKFGLLRTGEIFGFSKWLLANNIIGFLFNRSYGFIIGKIADAHALGIYSLSYDVANMATTELVAPIRRAIFPGYALMAADRALMRKGYVEVWALTLMIAMPMAVGIGALAGTLVRFALGPNWFDAIPLIQILSIYGLASIASTNVTPLFYALGKPRAPTILVLVGAIASVPLLLIGTAHYGVVGAAVAATIANITFLVAGLIMSMRELQLGVGDLVHGVWRSIVAVIVMVLVVIGIKDGLMPVSQNAIYAALKLALCIPAGTVVYIGVHLGLWRLAGMPKGPESYVLGAVAELRARAKRRRSAGDVAGISPGQ